MSRLRLLYCIDTVGHDAGSEKQLGELIRRLDQERFEIHLCCFEESDRLAELSRFCTPLILPVPSFYRRSGARALRRLHRYLHEHDIQVMHTFMVDANILGVLAARRSPCRTVISSRRNLGYWMRPLHRPLYRLLNHYTTRLLANSEAVRRQVLSTERVSSEKVDVIHNGVDLAAFGPGLGRAQAAAALGVPLQARVVGIVANLRPVKDHALFLRAARLVAARVPEAVFLLVGSGVLREQLVAQVHALGIRDRVFFSDGRGAVVDYLSRMEIGCLSSASEGLSNTLLEYMATGLPVVATDVGGNGEAVVNGETGFLVPHGDAEAMAARVTELLADPGLGQAMGARGRQRCQEHFEIGAVARRHEAYYFSLFGEASGSRM